MWAYRALLRLLPASLRSRHGAEMEAAFVERLDAARVRDVGDVEDVGAPWRSRIGRLGVVVAGCWDVVRRAGYEWGRRVMPSPGGWSNLWSDVRFALRTFIRRPGITLVAVIMLALGVAAATAVFTLVDGLFLRPLPFPEPDRLVYVDETAPKWNLELVGVSYADFATWREGQRAFEALGLLSQESYNLSSATGVERVDGAAVTYDLAAVLGIEPVQGRVFRPDEDRPGAAPVVMLGYDLWRRQFGGSGSVIGETIRLNGEPHTVVGVLPREAEFPGEVQLWTPLRGDPTHRGSYSYGGTGRLKPGVTVEAAQADLHRVHQSIWDEHDEDRVVSPVVMPLRTRLAGDLTGAALALGLAAGLVLLIACGNVASILLARSFSRRRELGVRVALGAGRGRLVRQLFAESLALALVAGPLGLVLGFWLVRLLSAGLPEGLPPWMVLEPSWRMGLFGLGLVLVTTVLFGWAPVLQGRRTEVREALSEGGGRTGASRVQRRTMDGLVIAEVALAALLLVSGGLLLRAFERLQDVDPGFRTENVLGFRVALPEASYPDSAARAGFYQRLLAGLESLPGVRAAGGIDCPPLGCHTGGFFTGEDGLGTDPEDANPVVLYRHATPGYFDAMGIRATRGRVLTEDDSRPGAPGVVVINETFARTFFPGVDDPVGRRVTYRGRPIDERARRVVGVTRDVMHYGVDEPMRPALYLPNDRSPRPSLMLFMWTEAPPESLLPNARSAVAALDPELPLFQVQSTAGLMQESLALRRATTWSMMVFAGLALVLALGGIYGVLSYVVGQRSREMGIRVALGSSRGRILRLVLRHGLVLAGVGTVLGFGAALAGGRALESLLVDFSALDPLTYGVAATVLLGAAMAASWVPARRAVSVEPGAVLREE